MVAFVLIMHLQKLQVTWYFSTLGKKMTEELQPSKISRNIYKAVLFLICGIVVLSTLEYISLLKSPKCFIEEGKGIGLHVWYE